MIRNVVARLPDGLSEGAAPAVAGPVDGGRFLHSGELGPLDEERAEGRDQE